VKKEKVGTTDLLKLEKLKTVLTSLCFVSAVLKSCPYKVVKRHFKTCEVSFLDTLLVYIIINVRHEL